jgi:hypothetical protein
VPFLKDHGKLYEAVGGGAGAKAFEEKLKGDRPIYGEVVVTVLQPPHETEIGAAGTADMVLTFRNVHHWLPDVNTEDYFKAVNCRSAAPCFSSIASWLADAGYHCGALPCFKRTWFFKYVTMGAASLGCHPL